jgi:hypothetical protein
MTTIENAKIWCKKVVNDNPPKKGENYYFENDNYMSYAKEITHNLFSANTFAAKMYFTKFQKIFIDGIYENKNGIFVGYWYQNGTYRTCKISEIELIDSEIVKSIGLLS